MTRFTRILVLISCCLSGMAISGFGQDRQYSTNSAQAFFDEANTLYQKGEFETARDRYLNLVGMGYDSATLWYNIGNTRAKLGETGRALAAYERALRAAPRDPDIKANLTLISPAGNRQQSFILLRPFSLLLDSFTLNEFFLIADILYILLCLVLVAKFLSNGRAIGNISRKLVTPLLILLVIALGFFSVKYHAEIVVKSGIIIQDKTIARSGPGDEFTEIFVLPEGTKFHLLDQQADGWAKITIPDQGTAYVPAPAFEMI